MSDDDRRAAATITRILNRTGDADPDVVALEIIQTLRGHGWRPTPARRPEPWQPRPQGGDQPTPEYWAARESINTWRKAGP